MSQNYLFHCVRSPLDIDDGDGNLTKEQLSSSSYFFLSFFGLMTAKQSDGEPFEWEREYMSG